MSRTTLAAIARSVARTARIRASQAARAKRLARRAAGAHGACPIEIVEGAASPSRQGEEAHYETLGGTWIRHPSAYSRRGWSSMRYCASSQRVVVGQLWLDAQ